MKYIIYLRVSTDQQAMSGLGLDAQREICLSYISKNGSNPHLEYIDDGYSGSLELDKRPALLMAISELQNGDILLIAKRDRIGRDPIVNAMIERAVDRKKARLISASGDVRDDNDPSSILMRRMVDAFSEYERLIIGARTQAALQVKKKRNERVGYIPYGYKLSPDKIHLEIFQEEQDVIKTIVGLKEEGLSIRDIVDELIFKSIPNRNGEKWSRAAVHRIVKE